MSGSEHANDAKRARVGFSICRQDFDGATQGVACVSLTCSSHDRYVRIAFN